MDQQVFYLSYLLILALAFFVWVAFGRKPAAGENVSLMRYCVGSGLISSVGAAGAVAVTYLTARTGASEMRPWLILAIAAASGIAYGMLALGRSHDAGKGRRFAAIGIIPVACLWLMFATPAPDAARPPYRPRNRLLRFVIGVTALAVGSSLPQLLELAVSGRLPRGGEPPTIVTAAEFSAINANLPQRLDQWTVLDRIDYDLRTKELFYRHILDLPADADLNGLGERVKTSTIPKICETQGLHSLMAGGFSLVYTYETSSGEAIPGFTIRLSDCP